MTIIAGSGSGSISQRHGSAKLLPLYLEKSEWCRHDLVPRVEGVTMGRSPPRHKHVARQAHRVYVQAAVRLLR
jgi:hypothetical protein